MGKIVSFMNNKGGVAKTMSAFNIGVYWAQLGKKVLLIDLDSQATLTNFITAYDPRYEKYVNGLEDWELTLDAAFELGPKTCRLPILKSRFENIDFVPTTLHLQEFDIRTATNPSKAYLLLDFITPVKDNYDYIIIDCPPALGSLIFNAMVASDGILMVTGANGPAFDGTKMITKSFNEIVSDDRMNPNLKLYGVLVTNVENDTINKQMIQLIRDTYRTYVMQTMIRKSTKLNQASTMKLSIFEHEPNGRGASDYGEVAKELLMRME